jgi:hypothetical protein
MAHLTSESGGFAHHNEESARIKSLLPLYLRETAAFSAESNAAGQETSLIALLEEYYKYINSPGMVLSVEVVADRSDSSFIQPLRSDDPEFDLYGFNVSTGHDGSGHGLTVDFVVGTKSTDAGKIIEVSVNNPGQGYKRNDLVRITDGRGSNAELRITDVISGPSDVINRILAEHDLNTVSDDYINEFQKEVAVLAPTSSLARISKKELFKKILTYYNTRGSENSIYAFFRIFFDTDVTVFYPKHYIFKTSAATFRPSDYIPTTQDNNTVVEKDTLVLDRPIRAAAVATRLPGNTRVDLDPSGNILVDIRGSGNTSIELKNYDLPPTQTRIRIPGLAGYSEPLFGEASQVNGFPGEGPRGNTQQQFEAAFEPCNVFFSSDASTEYSDSPSLRNSTAIPGWACPGSIENGGAHVVFRDPDTFRWFVYIGAGIRKKDSEFDHRTASRYTDYVFDEDSGSHHSLPDVLIPTNVQNKTYSSLQNLGQNGLIHTTGVWPQGSGSEAIPPLTSQSWNTLQGSFSYDGRTIKEYSGSMTENLIIESIHNPGVALDINGTYIHQTAADGSDTYVNVNNNNIRIAQVSGRWSIIDISPKPPETFSITKDINYRYLAQQNHPYTGDIVFNNGLYNDSWLKGTWTKQTGGAKFSFLRQKTSQSNSTHPVTDASDVNPGFAHEGAVISPVITSDYSDINDENLGAKLSTFNQSLYSASQIPDIGVDGWFADFSSSGYGKWEIDWQTSEWTHTAPAGEVNSYGEYLPFNHAMFMLYDPDQDGVQDDDSNQFNFITIDQKFSIFRMIASNYSNKPASMWVLYDHWRNTIIAHTEPFENVTNTRNDKLYPPKSGWIGTGRVTTHNPEKWFGLGDPRTSTGLSAARLGTLLTYTEETLSIADARVLYQDTKATSDYSSIIEYVSTSTNLSFEPVQDSTIQDLSGTNLVTEGDDITDIDTPDLGDQLDSSTPTDVPDADYTRDNKFYIHDYSPALNVELFDDSPLQPDKIVYVVDGFTNNRSVLNGTYEFYNQEGDGSPNFPQKVRYRHASSHNSPNGAASDSPLYELELVTDSNDGGGAVLKTTRELDSPNGPTFFSNLSTIGDGTDLRPGQKPVFEGTVSVQPRYIGVPARINFYNDPVTFTDRDFTSNTRLYEERVGVGESFYPKKISASNNMFLKPGHIYGSNNPNEMSIVEQDSSPVRVGPTQHLIMPFNAAGKAFTSISINDGHQHIFTFATENSTVNFFDNSPVSATPTDSITLKAGQSHTFISRINSNKHAVTGVGSENFPGTVYVRSTGNILASTATFEKQDSPKAPIEAPKAMAVLHPTSTISYIKNPFNSPDASPSNIIAVDQYLNTNFDSPGLLNRTDFTLSDAIFSDQSPPEAENTFLGSFIKAGNSPSGSANSPRDFHSSPNAPDNSSPNAKMSIFSINDGFGNDMTAGISLSQMRDNYVYVDKLTDYCLITPYDNVIDVQYKLPRNVLISDSSSATFTGYQLRDFNISNDSYASPTGVNAFYTKTNSNLYNEPSGKFMIMRRKPGTYRVATPDLGTKNGQWSIMRVDDSSPGRRAVYFVDENIISQTDDISQVRFIPAYLSEKRISTHGFSSNVGEVYKAESDSFDTRIKTAYQEYTYKSHTLSANLNSPNGVQVYGPVSSIDASPDAGARDPIVVPDSPRSFLERLVPQVFFIQLKVSGGTNTGSQDLIRQLTFSEGCTDTTLKKENGLIRLTAEKNGIQFGLVILDQQMTGLHFSISIEI